jgi:hypothetical protein
MSPTDPVLDDAEAPVSSSGCCRYARSRQAVRSAASSGDVSRYSKARQASAPASTVGGTWYPRSRAAARSKARSGCRSVAFVAASTSRQGTTASSWPASTMQSWMSSSVA